MEAKSRQPFPSIIVSYEQVYDMKSI